MRSKYLVLLMAFTLLVQCAPFPQLPSDTRYNLYANGQPRLLPASSLIAELNGDGARDEANRILARAAALRSEARKLRRPVLSGPERRLLRRAIARTNR